MNALRNKTVKSLINLTLERVLGYKFVKSSGARENRRGFITRMIEEHSDLIQGDVLNVGAGSWTWPKDRFGKRCNMQNLDQFAGPNTDIIGDAMRLTESVPKEHYDAVICIETLEHVPDPFKAANEIGKVLKKGGVLLASSPFMHELHGENYGDYWRITRQGWKELFKGFSSIEIFWLGREKEPLHYFVIAKK
ncbi:MAG: methyltransferase domain-containing protein [Candidatus Taylorbacteria bacterium]|nr:methyltransferase domain-containing protein [Candidatus Taylorbacteria bacterium]